MLVSLYANRELRTGNLTRQVQDGISMPLDSAMKPVFVLTKCSTIAISVTVNNSLQLVMRTLLLILRHIAKPPCTKVRVSDVSDFDLIVFLYF